MAYSYTAFTGNGSTTQYAVSFPYIRREHIAVTVAGIASTFTWVNNSLIQMDAAPANGAAVRVYRTTPISAPLVDFADGATLVAADLDTNSRQSIYIQQELGDAQVDNLADLIPNGNKGDITTSASGAVWAINAGAVTSAKILDGTIVDADVSASAGIVATKLSFTQAGTGATARTIDSKLKETVSVKDFGAVGDGTTDDSGSILAAFNAVRTVGGGTVSFPKATYLISHGFNIPTNTVILLNGSTLRATTTFSQGIIPTNGAASIFEISHKTVFGGDPDIKDIAIVGDGAILDGRRNEQTGTPPGYSGILIETSSTPVQADLWKINNITVSDLTIRRAGYDGVYVAGAADFEFKNVRVLYGLRIGASVIASKNGRFIDCEASYSVGPNAGLAVGQQGPGNSGDGFWNEPNASWQSIDIRYLNCYATKNYQSGFKPFNAGADSDCRIELISCRGYDNCWDEVTQTRRSLTAEANFRVSLNDTANAEFCMLLKNCVSESSERSGLSIQRGTATGSGNRQRIIVENFTAINCNLSNTDGVNRAPIQIGSATGYTSIIIDSPKIVAPAANTLGYGIAVTDTTNVHVIKPIFIGRFSGQSFYTGTLPGSRTTNSFPNFTADPASDQTTAGVIGDITKFYAPIRLASWDQTSEPSASSDMFANELSVWQDDNDQFVGIYKRDDNNTFKYINFHRKKRIRGFISYAGGVINDGTQITLTATITGAEVGDIVQTSYTADLVRCFVFGYVEAVNSVKLIISNNSGAARTVPAGNLIANIFAQDF